MSFEYLAGWTLLLSPKRARELAEAGCDTREKVLDYLWKTGSMTIGEMKARGHFERFIARDIKMGTGKFPKEYAERPDDAMAPVFAKNSINVVVVGDPEGTNVMQGWMMYNADPASIDKWR